MATPVKPKIITKPKPVPQPRPITPAEQTEQEQSYVAPDALAPAAETGIAAPGQWDDVLAQYAQEAVEATPIPGGNFIGTRAGILSIAGEQYDNLDVIVLDHCFENTLYEGRFDENNPRNPMYFSLGS